MSDAEAGPGPDDIERAEIALEVGERLQRGEDVRPEEYPRHAEVVRELLPALRMVCELAEPPPPSLPGGLSRLGEFRLVREVGRGGMGVVYEAVQEPLGRRVALKVLHVSGRFGERQLRRFRNESRAAASLDHPHIVPVFATGTAEGIPYYAMRFIDGRDLSEVIRRLRAGEPAPGPLAARGPSFAREVARLAGQAAEALAHAHENEILHRDVKPSNLLVDGAGKLWITDFGVARIRGGLDLTATGEAVGTPRYMTPEQAAGRRAPPDPRGDIYSLGVTFYELLALRPAFEGEDRIELLGKVARGECRPPRAVDPSIPRDLETIVLKAMAVEPGDRYPTALEMAEDLRRFLDGRAIRARRPGVAERAARWVRRNRGLAAAAATGLALLAAGVGLAGLQYTRLLRIHNGELRAAIDDANRHRRRSERHDLAAQLRLAQQAVDDRDFEAAQDLLDDVGPGSNPGVGGEFAWRYLRRLARREVVRLPERPIYSHAMAVGGDGLASATSHGDHSMVIWDLRSERATAAIEDESNNLGAPVFAGDGLLVAMRCPASRACSHRMGIWDARTGGHLGDLRPGATPLDDPSSDGQWTRRLGGGHLVASVLELPSGRLSIRIWSLDSAPRESLPLASLEDLDAVAFAEEGPHFATRERGRLCLRSASTGEVVRDLGGADGGALLALSRDGRSLAVAPPGKAILVRDLGGPGGPAAVAIPAGARVASLGFDPTGESLLAVDEAGMCRLWDRRSGRVSAFAPDDLDRRRTKVPFDFSPDGRLLAITPVGNPGGTQPTVIRDVRTGARLGVLPASSYGTENHAFLPDGRSLVVGGRRSPRIWHYEPEPEPPQPAGHRDEAWAVAYSADGRVLASGSDDTDDRQTIRLWDAGRSRPIRGWYGGPGTVTSLAFSADGRRLLSGHLAPGANLRVWDVETGRLVRPIRAHPQGVRSLAISPDGTLVAAAGGIREDGAGDWKIRLWHIDSGRLVRELDGHANPVRSVAFSPDGRRLASAGNDRHVRLWDVETARLLRSARGVDDLAAAAFAPDGRAIAVANGEGAVTVRDAESLEARMTIRGPSDRLLGLAYAADGRSLATHGTSGAVRVWDALTGQPLLVLKGHKSQVNGLAFAPDQSSLASCSHDGEVRLWHAGPAVPDPDGPPAAAP
ncbi:Serine/threonine-protein kinase PrkC [Aquisphaera giovannonii]|uniref:Serine/threonine-protein kinase PrkC n=1 Tax=Aquisphaera giovannonii TaxID=406548 RepID=A0A5B9W484_9BACT|nr:protein kinase [Aquisphaera giovannonii]QEH35009.1 Serine/threonine-protein kinase PrkC [Aquisphaera giovannonii]